MTFPVQGFHECAYVYVALVSPRSSKILQKCYLVLSNAVGCRFISVTRSTTNEKLLNPLFFSYLTLMKLRVYMVLTSLLRWKQKGPINFYNKTLSRL